MVPLPGALLEPRLPRWVLLVPEALRVCPHIVQQLPAPVRPPPSKARMQLNIVQDSPLFIRDVLLPRNSHSRQVPAEGGRGQLMQCPIVRPHKAPSLPTNT